MGLPCAGQAQKRLVRRTRWGGVSRHADRFLDPQGRPTAHRYQHARRHRSCNVQAALSILQAAVRLKEVCPPCRNLLEHAHAQPASTRRGGEARRGDDATGSEAWRAAAATARRTAVDGSNSRQTAADGDTMAGTVGGRGEKTRVVHPLSKRSHSKGVKQ